MRDINNSHANRFVSQLRIVWIISNQAKINIQRTIAAIKYPRAFIKVEVCYI
ncbi:hypothetical protein Q5692_31430 [Microcoleus sp. C2C3]|uniref:hypothetical protein n=1 Tax=unclassified Microcoleus TaxID=2642155 RepID=UPI002FCF928C